MRKLIMVLTVGLGLVMPAGLPALADSVPSPKPAPKTVVLAAPAVVATPAPKIHVVGEGDSLSSIAEAEQLPSWKPLWDVNTEIVDPNLVYAGEQLTVPTEVTTDRPLPAGAEPVASVSNYQAPVRQAATAANYSGGAGGWAAGVRQRESGGNYATNTGNGYYGAYQFNLSTWRGVGGTGLPSDASPAEQDMRAQMLYNQRGCSPWPNTCR